MAAGKIDINSLSETKRELLSRLLREKLATQGTDKILRQEKKEYYPLSYNQEQLWFLDTLANDNPFYNVPFTMRFKMEIDLNIVQLALNKVVHRQQILKTSYIIVDGKPCQKIEHDFFPEIIYRNLEGETEPEENALKMLKKEATTAFKPGIPPVKAMLIRLSHQDYILMIKFHHILIDGWSIPIFNSEFLQAYRMLSQNQELQIPVLSPDYVDYSLWQRRKIREDGFERQRQYWMNHLGDGIDPLDLPTDFPRPKEQRFRGKQQMGSISGDLLQQLRIFCQGTEYTLFMVVVASFSLLLSRYANKQDILMGTQMANRVLPGLEPLIGYFSNSVVLRFQADAYLSFKEYLQKVKEVTRKAQDNQEFPFEKLVHELRVPRTLGQNPLFQVMLVYRNETITPKDIQALNVSPIRVENDTAKFDLDLLLIETKNQISISIIYNSDIFTPARIERIFKHLENLLFIISQNPDQVLSTIDFLSAEEKYKLVKTWNDTNTPYPKDSCLHTLFEQQVKEDPRASCAYFREKQVTREQLEEKANSLARHLKAQGIGPNDLVAICMEKSVEMVIGLIAILKAGGGYLPIDPTYPTSRIEYMLTQSRAGIILSQETLLELFPETTAGIICIDSQWEIISRESTQSCPLINTPEDIAYGIFTSGSTGNPKMTILDHRGRVNNFTDFNRRFEIGKSDRIVAVSSLGFDMCAYDILGSLACGSAIVLPEPDFELQPAHWIELMVRHEVTIWHSVPSKLELLTDYITTNPAYIPGKCRLVLLGGDWIPLNLPDRFREFVPNAVMVSMGGATEVSMDSTIFIIDDVESNWKSIPYGVPMANQLTYIIDANFNLVPEGVPGELCIGGVGVGWGYHDNPGLTAEKFIPNPWSNIPGDRMYRTGDLARYNSEGVLELLGRLDHQVKIRGYRIELGEIEAVINQHEIIDKALVMAKKDQGKTKNAPQIITWVIPKKSVDWELDREKLRQYLKERLPEYFIPSVIIFLEQFPLTPNGKIDRRALMAIETGEEVKEQKSNQLYTPPSSEIEKVLTEAWKNLLEIEEVSIHDNFFSIGGDSIKCIQLVTRARESGLDITLKQIFRHQTIAELAKELDREKHISEKQALPLTAHQYLLISQMETYTHPLLDEIWLELPSHISPEKCKEALIKITQAYDCFKLRFQSGENGWWQSIDKKRANLMYFTHMEIKGEVTSIYENETISVTRENLNKTIDLLDGPLLGAAVFTRCDRPVSTGSGQLLLLTVPRLILSGKSRYTLLEDLEGLLRKPGPETTTPLPVRGTFTKWARENQKKLYQGPVPVNQNPETPGEKSPIWKPTAFSLELSQVDGLKEILTVQPLLSVSEIILSTLCSALAQENKNGSIKIDLLLSGGGNKGSSPPPGSHGDFYTLQAEAGEIAEPEQAVKWVHQFLSVHKAGNRNGEKPRLMNESTALFLEIIEANNLLDIPSTQPIIKSIEESLNSRLCTPMGINGIQLILTIQKAQLWVTGQYDETGWKAEDIELIYQKFRELLTAVVQVYSGAGARLYVENDFPGTGITQTSLNRLATQYPGLIDIYSLGPMQRYMLRNCQQSGDKGLYVIQYAFYLPGNLNIPAFEKSWQQLLQRYEILRTVFFWKDLENPVQVVLQYEGFSIPVEDWREKSENRQREDLVEFLERERTAGFDLENGPLIRLFLLRLSNDQYLFLQFNSYFVLDGWSVFLLRKELLDLYSANAGQMEPKLAASPRYRNYIDWSKDQDVEAAQKFWKQMLQGITSPTYIHRVEQNQVMLAERKDKQEGIEVQTVLLDKETTELLEQLSIKNSITFNVLVMGSWYLVLRDWLKQPDLVFGVISSGRPPALENIERMAGILVNVIPLRLNWDTSTLLLEENHKIGKYLNSAAAYEYISLDEIEKEIGFCETKEKHWEHLFDSVLVFDNYPVDKSLLEMVSQEEVQWILPWDYLNFAHWEMPLRIAIGTGNIEGTFFVFSYYRDKFTPQIITELSKGLVEKLTQIARSPHQSVKEHLS